MDYKVGDVLEFVFNRTKRIGIIRKFNGNDEYKEFKIEVISGGFDGCHNCDGYFKKRIGLNLNGGGVTNVRKLTKLELFKLLGD